MNLPGLPRNLNDIVLLFIIFGFYVIYHFYYEKISSTAEKIENLLTNSNTLEWHLDSAVSSGDIKIYSEESNLIGKLLKDSKANKDLSLLASRGKALDSLSQLENIAFAKNAASTEKLLNFRSKLNIYDRELETVRKSTFGINALSVFL